ncbi:hypothetical protein C7212DRAFT_186186, partial [Tuber magnatum]
SAQRHAFQAVLMSVEMGTRDIFFLDRPGGAGKTFIENIILAQIRSEYENA